MLRILSVHKLAYNMYITVFCNIIFTSGRHIELFRLKIFWVFKAVWICQWPWFQLSYQLNYPSNCIFFSFSSLNGFLPCTYKKYGFGIRLTWVWLLFHRTLPIHWEYCELYLQNMFRIPPLLSSFTATVLVQSSTWAIVYNHLSGLPIFTLASSSQLIRDINIRVKIIKLLEESINVHCNYGIGNGCLGCKTQIKKNEVDKLDFFKIKNLLCERHHLKMASPKVQEFICTYIWKRTGISNIQRTFTTQKITIQNNIGKIVQQKFYKRSYPKGHKHMKNGFISLTSENYKLKSQRYTFTTSLKWLNLF